MLYRFKAVDLCNISCKAVDFCKISCNTADLCKISCNFVNLCMSANQAVCLYRNTCNAGGLRSLEHLCMFMYRGINMLVLFPVGRILFHPLNAD